MDRTTVDEPTDDPIAATLRAQGAATLGESGARRMRNRVAAVWPGAAVVGPAVPVGCTPGDNLAIHVAVTRAADQSDLSSDVLLDRLSRDAATIRLGDGDKRKLNLRAIMHKR